MTELVDDGSDSGEDYFRHALSLDKRGNRTVAKQVAFLNAYSTLGVISYAAKAANVSRRTVLRWRHGNEEFSAAFEVAQKMALDSLVDMAFQRALGTDRLRFGRNDKPLIDPRTGDYYVEKSYSDILLIFLLKKLDPERFGDSAHLDVSANAEIRVVFQDEYSDRLASSPGAEI